MTLPAAIKRHSFDERAAIDEARPRNIQQIIKIKALSGRMPTFARKSPEFDKAKGEGQTPENRRNKSGPTHQPLRRQG